MMRARERGLTLLELTLAMAMMVVVIAGGMALMVAAGRSGRSSTERSVLQSGGRAGLDVLANEIALAGLGLPRRLAIKSFVLESQAADACATTQEIEIASLDYEREWTVTAVAPGTLTLDTVLREGGLTDDVSIAGGTWVFVYQNASEEPGSFGHGMLHVGMNRAIGEAIAIDSTDFSTAQSTFDGQPLMGRSGHPLVMLLARVSRFRLVCPNATTRYLAWELNGQTVPVATNVDSLTFSFYLDADGDGVTDAGPVTDPTADQLQQVTGVQIRLVLQSVDPANNQVSHEETYVQRVDTPNIHTQTNSRYVFFDNLAL